MKIIKTTLIAFLITFLVSCIVITPTRTEDDYFSSRPDLEKMQITFIELDSTFSLLEQCDEIYLFATWCPHCYVYLSDFEKEGNNKVALVSINYNVSIIEKKLSSNIDTIYILKNSIYGDKEHLKIERFQQFLTGGFDSIVGMPQRFYNQEGKWDKNEIKQMEN